MKIPAPMKFADLNLTYTSKMFCRLPHFSR